MIIYIYMYIFLYQSNTFTYFELDKIIVVMRTKKTLKYSLYISFCKDIYENFKAVYEINVSAQLRFLLDMSV